MKRRVSFPSVWLRRSSRPPAYSGVQMALHWLIALLVLLQYSTSGAIVRTHAMHLIGHPQNPTDLLIHALHTKLGLALIALMVGRLAFRFWAGAPPPGGGGSTWNSRIARFVHAAFYVVLLAEGLTGAVASYFWWPIRTVHVILFKILLGLISIHVAAALWHALYLRDATLSRMIPMRLFGRPG